MSTAAKPPRGISKVRIYDAGDASWDRYTAVYLGLPEHRMGLYSARGMSEHPYHPQGFGQWTTAMPGRHLGKRIPFAALPVDCQSVVRSDMAA